VSRPVAPWPFLGHPPPSLPQPAIPRPAPEGTPVASASPILNAMSRPRGTMSRATQAGCRGALGGACSGMRKQWSPASIRGMRPGGGAKMPFILPIRLTSLHGAKQGKEFIQLHLRDPHVVQEILRKGLEMLRGLHQPLQHRTRVDLEHPRHCTD